MSDLEKASEIYLSQAGLRCVHITITGLYDMVQPQQRMEQRRFSSAVRPEDKRDGLDRDGLEFLAEGLEVRNAERLEFHDLDRV